MIYINIIIICVLHFLIINPLEKLSFLLYKNNIKNINIYRPKQINYGNKLFNNLGMPSGHSEIIVILCILLYIKYNFDIKFLILLILLTGLERIISKNHTIFQVIIGYLFGIFYGMIYIKNPNYVYLIIPIIILLMFIQFENNKYNIPKYIDNELLEIIKSKYNINIFIKITEIIYMLFKYILLNNETYNIYYNWEILENDMDKLIDKIINSIDINKIDYIVGIKSGGAIITSYIAKKLKKLREKPQHIKERIMFVFLVIAFVIVAAIWYLTSDFSRLDLPGLGDYVQTTKTYIANEPKIFDSKMPDNIATKIVSTSTQTNPILATSTNIDESTSTQPN